MYEVPQSRPSLYDLGGQTVHLNVPIIADYQALGCVKHDDSMRHIVDRCYELYVSFLHPPICNCTSQAQAKNKDCSASDTEGKRARRQ
jgi:hypothetical protein